MPLHYNSQEIADLYYGSQKIDSAYYGSTLVYSANPYEPSTVLLNVTSPVGDTTISLEKGIYKLEIVGPGSNGNGAAVVAVGIIYYGGGGGGAAYVGEVMIPKGTYHYGLASVNSGSPAYLTSGVATGTGVIAGGAQASSFTRFDGNLGGTLTVTSSWIVGTPEINSNGRQGTSTSGFSGVVAGAASLYNGYGAGGASEGSGTNGLIKLTYLRTH